MSRRLLTASLLVAISANLAFADEEGHADILIGRPEVGTQTLIGGANVPDDLNLDERLFEGELGTRFSPGGSTNNVYFALEPGFFNAGEPDPVTGLGLEDAINPAGLEPMILDDEIVVTPVGPLLFWDGSRPIFFSVAAAVLSVFPLDNQADANGAIDDHPLFEIDLPGSDDLPEGGVYLATFTAQITGPNGALDASDEFQVLFATAAFEEELEIAEAFLTGEIPEPASLTLFAVLTALAGRRRSFIA